MTYAKEIIKLFDIHGCISGQEVLMENVEKCFKSGAIDVEVVN